MNEDIKTELNHDEPSECLLTDFDDNFPAKARGSQRFLEIFKIIMHCAQNSDAYKNVLALTVSDNHFLVSKQDIKQAIAIQRDECPNMFANDDMANDSAIMCLIAVSQRMNVPYLIYLADMYQRERVKNLENGLSVDQWCQTNLHCIDLGKMKVVGRDKKSSLVEDIKGALVSYFHRITPKLMLSPKNVIVDSLLDTCEYITSIVAFAAGLAAEDKTTCPFQFDAVLAFNEVKRTDEKVMFEQKSDSEVDDDDDDSKNECFYDCFGDIKEKLSAKKLPFSEFPIKDDEKDDGLRRVRMFLDGFKKFKSEQIEKKYKGKEYEEYPRKHRFCAVIDRRKPDKKGNANKNILKEDELIIFEPPNNCNSFPETRHGALFHFDLSRTCIIPCVSAKDGAEEIVDFQKKKLFETITSQSNCNGAMIVLSFHVESTDEIRCYCYINGQIMRFMPSDIINLLPLFFDKEFGDNKKFAVSKRAKELVEEMSDKLIDIHFDAFFQKYQSKMKNDEK